MTETKLEEETPKSPYDLWPDESESVVPAGSEPETIVTGAFDHAPDAPLPETEVPGSFDSAQPSPFHDPYAAPSDSHAGFDAPFEAPFIPVVYTPETTEQSVRNSGLAWSAGVVFFGSVAFMLFLGWLADLLLGSSPYGIVIGIVLGSIIGFIQFFRISSQIFSTKKPDPDHRPLLSRDDDE